MALRYSDTPQLHYGKQPAPNADWRQRFPASAQPIASAPTNTSTPVWVFEPDGSGFLSVHHRGQWQKMMEDRDDRTGQTQLRMMGEAISNPVAWAPQGQKQR
jgi:hypothetical protein